MLSYASSSTRPFQDRLLELPRGSTLCCSRRSLSDFDKGGCRRYTLFCHRLFQAASSRKTRDSDQLQRLWPFLSRGIPCKRHTSPWRSCLLAGMRQFVAPFPLPSMTHTFTHMVYSDLFEYPCSTLRPNFNSSRTFPGLMWLRVPTLCALYSWVILSKLSSISS